MFKRCIPILISLITILVITTGCASTGNTNNSSSEDRSVIEVNDSDFTLADYLRKVPGVNIQGGGVKIRNATSFGGDTRALFVVDGQKMGKSYSYIESQIQVTDIKSIKVLKGAEASIYGVQGANGVIEITTKIENENK